MLWQRECNILSTKMWIFNTSTAYSVLTHEYKSVIFCRGYIYKEHIYMDSYITEEKLKHTENNNILTCTYMKSYVYTFKKKQYMIMFIQNKHNTEIQNTDIHVQVDDNFQDV